MNTLKEMDKTLDMLETERAKSPDFAGASFNTKDAGETIDAAYRKVLSPPFFIAEVTIDPGTGH